ncbi:MAG: cytochrome P450 [Marmoricola sp.]
MAIKQTAKSFGFWAITHGVQRFGLTVGARKGDLAALLTVDPALRANPFPGYEQLRGQGTIVPGAMVYSTVSHAAINEILRSEHFSVAGDHQELPGPLPGLVHRLSDPWAAGPVDPPSMLAVDPPVHGRYRKLVSRAFTARSVHGLEGSIGDVVSRELDALESGPDEVDLVETFAARIPVAIIADLLGVPAAMHDQLLDWGNAAAITLDPGLSWRQFREAEAAVRALHLWIDDHLRNLRANPGDDILSRLLQGEAADQLTDVELRQTALLVLGAGFETTVNLIGNAVMQLHEHPDQRKILAEEPSLWGNAVEEVLRYDSPVQLTLRQATQDVEVVGVRVRAGTAILSMLGGANRDPSVFKDPQTFDVTRDDADKHVSFSAGAHYCLGASLARLEATTALSMLYDRFPDLEVSGPGERRGTRVLRGYEHLPVRLR